MNDILIPFQWSIKLDDGQIYMVQAMTSDDLGLAKQEIQSKFLDKDPMWIQTISNAQRQTTSQPTAPQPNMCPIHNVAMKQYTKNGSSWYAHQFNNTWCNGK